jgi:outer membrane murein-binding lipoprotein Lpp
VKLTLIIIGIACVAFIGGFLLSGWVRQATIDELQREVKQCQDGRARLQEIVDGLASELGMLRRSLGG